MKTEHLYRISKMDIETRIMKTAEDKVSNAIETTSSQAPKIRLRKPIEWISCIVSKDQCQLRWYAKLHWVVLKIVNMSHATHSDLRSNYDPATTEGLEKRNANHWSFANRPSANKGFFQNWEEKVCELKNAGLRFSASSALCCRRFWQIFKKQTFGNATTPISQRGDDTWKRVLVARQIISRAPRRMGVM